jgi:FtsZ-interacting cell division protein ZipA
MSTLAVILIVIGAVILIALAFAAWRRAREGRLEDRRHIAIEHREEATGTRLEAEQKAAAADEQAARARREAAEAESLYRAAERQREASRAHTERAAELDPDADVDERPVEPETREPADQDVETRRGA